jgi:chlorite dismutase
MESVERDLNHFASYAFEASFWALEAGERGALLQKWWGALEQVGKVTHLYQVYPAEATVDLLVWSALPVEDDQSAAEFFERYARATNSVRGMVRMTRSLWGFTGRSSYSKARSAQEMDPYGGKRRRYLVVYPFVKRDEWYLMSREARQGMMNEHIRIGKGYSTILQLLLYSFGLQDQEFVVVYEMDDLPLFSDLVHELRNTEARRFTVRDTPLQTAVYRTPEELLGLWAG